MQEQHTSKYESEWAATTTTTTDNQHRSEAAEIPHEEVTVGRSRRDYEGSRGQWEDGYGGRDADYGHGRGDSEDFGRNLVDKKFKAEELEKFDSDVYRPSAASSERSAEEVERFRRDADIAIVSGAESAPKPIVEFDEAGFPEEINAVLRSMGFERPTPIQSQGWPIAMTGRDLVAIGETGSGKTLGFVLPALLRIDAQRQSNPSRKKKWQPSPTVLVLAPTRELAQQIDRMATPFCHRMSIQRACLFGGSAKGHQYRELDRDPAFITATPGRLIDMVETGALNLENSNYVVLDEADRMLDMGFEPQIR